jgi:VanZ family protein
MTLPAKLEPQPPMKPAALARFRALSTGVLACYWLAMFTGTHWPNFTLIAYPKNTDKILHLSAYAGLSFLIAVRLELKREVRLRDGLWIMAVIVAYSIFDEVTQPYFGRTCDIFDALADWVGGIFGLGAFAVLRRLLRPFAAA